MILRKYFSIFMKQNNTCVELQKNVELFFVIIVLLYPLRLYIFVINLFVNKLILIL